MSFNKLEELETNKDIMEFRVNVRNNDISNNKIESSFRKIVLLINKEKLGIKLLLVEMFESGIRNDLALKLKHEFFPEQKIQGEIKMSLEEQKMFLEEPDLKHFLEFRKIKLEDYSLIVKFAKIPKDIFFDFHNSFGMSKVDTVERDLKGMINCIDNNLKEADEKRTIHLKHQKNACELFLELLEKYDICVCKNLHGKMEWRKRNLFKNKTRF